MSDNSNTTSRNSHIKKFLFDAACTIVLVCICVCVCRATPGSGVKLTDADFLLQPVTTTPAVTVPRVSSQLVDELRQLAEGVSASLLKDGLFSDSQLRGIRTLAELTANSAMQPLLHGDLDQRTLDGLYDILKNYPGVNDAIDRYADAGAFMYLLQLHCTDKEGLLTQYQKNACQMFEEADKPLELLRNVVDAAQAVLEDGTSENFPAYVVFCDYCMYYTARMLHQQQQ